MDCEDTIQKTTRFIHFPFLTPTSISDLVLPCSVVCSALVCMSVPCLPVFVLVRGTYCNLASVTYLYLPRYLGAVGSSTRSGDDLVISRHGRLDDKASS